MKRSKLERQEIVRLMGKEFRQIRASVTYLQDLSGLSYEDITFQIIKFLTENKD